MKSPYSRADEGMKPPGPETRRFFLLTKPYMCDKMTEGGTKCHKVSVRRYGMSKKKSEREEALRLPEGIPETEETPFFILRS